MNLRVRMHLTDTRGIKKKKKASEIDSAVGRFILAHVCVKLELPWKLVELNHEFFGEIKKEQTRNFYFE